MSEHLVEMGKVLESMYAHYSPKIKYFLDRLEQKKLMATHPKIEPNNKGLQFSFYLVMMLASVKSERESGSPRINNVYVEPIKTDCSKENLMNMGSQVNDMYEFFKPEIEVMGEMHSDEFGNALDFSNMQPSAKLQMFALFLNQVDNDHMDEQN